MPEPDIGSRASRTSYKLLSLHLSVQDRTRSPHVACHPDCNVRDPDILHLDIFPRTFLLPDSSLSLFTWCRTFPPSTTTTRQSTMRSTVNVYKTDSGRSARFRVRVSASFQMFALTVGEKCPKWGRKLSREMSGRGISEGNVPGGMSFGRLHGTEWNADAAHLSNQSQR